MNRFQAWLAVGLVVAASGTAVAAKIPEGAETPQALVERLQAAAKKSDGYELAACTIPEDRNMVAGSLVFGTTMMVGMMGMDPEHRTEAQKHQQQLETILKKYGVDKNMKDPASLPKKSGEPDFAMLVKGTDTVGLTGDLLKFMKSLPGVSGEGPFAEFTTVTDVKVDGDKATAKGGTGPLEFVKLGGRWYVHLAPPMESEGASPDADAPDTD